MEELQLVGTKKYNFKIKSANISVNVAKEMWKYWTENGSWF
jgi:hypothetical protein